MLGKFAMGSLAIGAGYYMLPAGKSDSLQTFAQPAETATNRIKAERRVVNGTGMGSLTIESGGRDQQALLVSVKRAGDPRRVKCRVTISPVSPAESTAEVDCTQPAVGDEPLRPVAIKAMEIIVREHVAATIEKRLYDTDRVADRMIGLIAMNGPAIAASMNKRRE